MALFAAEASAEKCEGNLACKLHTYTARPHAKDSHVIVLYALVSRVGVMAHCRTNAIDLVGCDTGPDSATAHENSSLDLAAGDGPSDGFSEVRVVVVSIVDVGSDLHYLNAFAGEYLG